MSYFDFDECPNCGHDLLDQKMYTSPGNFYLCEDGESIDQMLERYSGGPGQTIDGHDSIADAQEEAQDDGLTKYKIYNSKLEVAVSVGY